MPDKIIFDYSGWASEHDRDIDLLIDAERQKADARWAEFATVGIERDSHHLRGLALSGGGIRSATFSLGLMREMAAQKLLHKFDYLSTVSGGSYIGSYYTALFAGRGGDAILSASSFRIASGPPTDSATDNDPSQLLVDPFDDPDEKPKASLDYLRQYGRYLAPSGAGDFWQAIGIVIRNWLGVQLVIGSALVFAALLAVGWRLALYSAHFQRGWIGAAGSGLPPILIAAPLLLFLSIPVAVHIAISWAYWLTKRDGDEKSFSGLTPALRGNTAIALLATAVVFSPARGLEQIFGGDQSGWGVVRVTALAIGGFSITGWLLLLLAWLAIDPGSSTEQAWDKRRSFLTRPMRFCAGGAVLVATLALTDAVAFKLYTTPFKYPDTILAAPPFVAAVLVPAGKWLFTQLLAVGGSRASPAPAKAPLITSDLLLKIGGMLVAIILLATIAIGWTVYAYWAVWPSRSLAASITSTCALQPTTGATTILWNGCAPWPAGPIAFRWLAWFLMTSLLVYSIGRTRTFLNLSGLTGFYASRLRRAYLGASNIERIAPEEGAEQRAKIKASRAQADSELQVKQEPADHDGWTRRTALRIGSWVLAQFSFLERLSGTGNVKGKTMRSPDRLVSHDDVTLVEYCELAKYGAPLHLINITLNETRGAGSNLVQRDRRGRNLVVSPEGVYCDAERRDHIYVLPYKSETDDEKRSEHEPLPLSTWIAISGAAFSTGLGNRTGFPLSELAGLANVRLGYWWRISRAHGKPTQVDLFREFRGDFSGPSQRNWYLTDGGHFENTGVYELIRRRLPVIVVSDNGMDQRFEYEDVANLVRKARIDFGCDIDFLGARDLDLVFRHDPARRNVFGTLTQIAGADPNAQHAVAALARLRYPKHKQKPEAFGTMILIKPRLTGDGPADLVRYKAANIAFPQQTTIDQFFDEAQWESYYHLGRLIAQSIFGPRPQIAKDAQAWSPDALVPLSSNPPRPAAGQ